MQIVRCDFNKLDELDEFYGDVIDYLESTFNYPFWSHNYINKSSIKRAIERGEQYCCLDNDKVVGAFILNEDPQGSYEKGNWSEDLASGEFEVIHTFAVAINAGHKGIGSFMVSSIIDKAKRDGYKAFRLDVVPRNTPASSLYIKHGFKSAGSVDLDRGYDEIPIFDLYELNF